MKNILFTLFLLLYIPSVFASGGYGEDASHQEQELKGPNGGKLLEKNGFSIEVTIFESGIPPEMRLFAYNNGVLLDPDKVKITVVLSRLGGVQDTLKFTAEKDYLVGDLEVVEPHSFDVNISAKYNNTNYQWQYQNHEGRAEISDRLLSLSGLQTEKLGAKELVLTDTLFGVISIPDNRKFKLHAAYSGLVKKIFVKVGDSVKAGQRLAVLQNTQTLQDYFLVSPTDGEVSEVNANVGDRADVSAIIEIIDLSEVWVDLSAFPQNIERLMSGQTVEVYDLHQHERALSTISYIAPKMTGGHIARARAIIDNKAGHWRPGMHIKADIEIKKRQVPMAVKVSAIQSFREMPVVFAKYGNTFEVRMVQLGETDGEYIEVLGGIEPDTEYVSENSFLLKAEVLKDGASHDH